MTEHKPEIAQTWQAHFWRYAAEHFEPFYTSREAIQFLERGEDEGTLTTWGVVHPNGTETLCPHRGGSDDEWAALANDLDQWTR